MKKSIFLASSLVSVLLFITGCGEDSGEACKYEAIKLVDAGSYDAAIAEANSCSAFTANERRTVLADAYMGKGGFSVTDVLKNLSDANTDFIDTMMRSVTSTKLENLEKAHGYYDAILNGETCSATATKEIKDACFATGLTSTVKASAGIGLLFSENDTLDAYINFDTIHKNTCTAKNVNGNTKLDETEALVSATTAMPAGGTDITISGVSYDYRETIINSICPAPNNENKLIKHIFKKGTNIPVLTEGFCSSAGTTCATGDQAGTDCYPCPIKNDDGTPKDMTTVIVNIFNQDISKVADIAGANSSIKADIEKIKTDICGSTTCTVDITNLNTYINQ